MDRATVTSTKPGWDGPAIFRRDGANEPPALVCLEIALSAVSKQDTARVAKLLRDALTPNDLQLLRDGVAHLTGEHHG